MSVTELYQQVERVLDQVRPALNADGGNVEIESIKDGRVRLRLLGACSTCSLAPITVRAGIERPLHLVRGIRSVEVVR